MCYIDSQDACDTEDREISQLQKLYKIKEKKKNKTNKKPEKIVNIYRGNLQVHRLQILKRKSGGENICIHSIIMKIFLSYSI